jgi:hypothetical protein
MCGVFYFTTLRPALLLGESRHQLGEAQEVSDPEERASPTDHDLWIGCDDIGPLPRHRADANFVDPQQKPRPVPVVALADADELLPAQRMEWMRHAHKARARVRRGCSSP